LKKIDFAVIGFGHIGSRHAEEISSHTGAELKAIVDTDADALKKAKEKYPAALYSSIDEFLLHKTGIDIVCICTPNGLHINQARQIIDEDMDVLVEKPLGLYKMECDDLIEFVKVRNRNLFCVLQNRYSPPAQYLKHIVGSLKLGKIFWVEVNCYWNRDERYYKKGGWRGTNELDGGTLYTQFSHFVDILYWVFGPVKNIEGRFWDFSHKYLTEFEDTGIFSFEFEHGGAGTFNYSTALWQQNMESSFTVIGEKGALKIGGQYMDKLEYFMVEGLEKPELPNGNPPNNYGSHQGSANNHAHVIDNVVKALNGQPFDIAKAEEAAASVAIIEEVYRIRDAQKIMK